jgi:lipopolysaccharide/colanic/teichoic acid biosynthesis glycosyltransferase
LNPALASRALTPSLTLISFAVALLLHVLATGSSLAALPYGVAIAVAVLTFWSVTELRNTDEDSSASVAFTEHVSLTTGINLIVQALLGYVFDLPLVPLPVLVGGSALASASLALLRASGHLVSDRRRHGLLMIGYDPAAGEVANIAAHPIVGVVDDDPSRVPPSLPLLGTLEQLADAIASKSQARIVIGSMGWNSRIPIAPLMQLKVAGVRVEDISMLYERLLRRVCYPRLNTSALLFSSTLKTGRHIMAIQAVYTDLMGLLLLIVLSPVLLLTGAAVALFSGPGPVLESIECLGFQNVPFQLLRFRTRNSRTGARTLIGELIARLHLVNLPQLINIIRGEVVFFGPRPVRKEFAERLAELLPFYPYKFSVKPGVLGWAQANVPRRTVPRETLRIEYDFYYIRQGSLALDFEILLRIFLGGKRQPETGEVTP